MEGRNGLVSSSINAVVEACVGATCIQELSGGSMCAHDSELLFEVLSSAEALASGLPKAVAQVAGNNIKQ